MRSVRFINNNLNSDPRGLLTSVEAYKETGILYKRFFLIQNVMGGRRGGHAHKFTDQILTIIKGSLNINYQYFNDIGNFELNHKSKPIFFPKLTWIEMTEIKKETIILVLSSDEYNIKNSIRDKNEFYKFIEKLEKK